MKLLPEKFVQDNIIEYLFRKGWSRNLRSKGTDEHGVDIKVRNNRYARYWLVECKGDASKTAKYPRSHREVCFNLALGQIITRMKSDGKRGYKYIYKYGVGFPVSFESMVVRRLPYSVADKLNLYIFLVDDKGKVVLYDWKKLREHQKA
ncbi:hypothetical protein A3D62_00835 [Candidatus Kaiserbacteria bacterium RIFCSPHIGHO2_02_FULL_49_11]|uniref:Restriction endonuclease type IV Mrr domain-containing protein n=1 Tax=Candidatus Kaiserbacteria bacterium RIFCSPHIGHO2_02_FULL_49_11 TaxID=1798489 RepID=A0A1F6D116_9BACT|nr:MAG: hypothetical protein A3D62_00835 [Candidatus Kaiserbacteria bacterium RIFCSPHIGHO2_02_FULL_49_11]